MTLVPLSHTYKFFCTLLGIGLDRDTKPLEWSLSFLSHTHIHTQEGSCPGPFCFGFHKFIDIHTAKNIVARMEQEPRSQHMYRLLASKAIRNTTALSAIAAFSVLAAYSLSDNGKSYIERTWKDAKKAAPTATEGKSFGNALRNIQSEAFYHQVPLRSFIPDEEMKQLSRIFMHKQWEWIKRAQSLKEFTQEMETLETLSQESGVPLSEIATPEEINKERCRHPNEEPVFAPFDGDIA